MRLPAPGVGLEIGLAQQGGVLFQLAEAFQRLAVLAARQRSLAEAGKGGAKSDESEDSYAERISAWITTFFRSAA